jgi:hypothetical protein
MSCAGGPCASAGRLLRVRFGSPRGEAALECGGLTPLFGRVLEPDRTGWRSGFEHTGSLWLRLREGAKKIGFPPSLATAGMREPARLNFVEINSAVEATALAAKPLLQCPRRQEKLRCARSNAFTASCNSALQCGPCGDAISGGGASYTSPSACGRCAAHDLMR